MEIRATTVGVLKQCKGVVACGCGEYLQLDLDERDLDDDRRRSNGEEPPWADAGVS